ncbi:hypothetical protein ES332_A13G064300v1 [Gossypium tomentosum]|uniref:Pentatricopeptide repeat-containing protein n=1 Tax=Gossypium tomentosum TaxID=34277 RepID=A0A5D2MGN6_GOSTO|nr:hypothetical protein ES332_A13G064300v1 [Gossypium tomentosum]
MASVGWLRSLSMFSIGCQRRIHLLGLPYLVSTVRIKNVNLLLENLGKCVMKLIRASAIAAALTQGKQVHCQYVRRIGWRNVVVESALVDLYARSSAIDVAHRIFMQMSDRNLITRSSMIYGFGQNGRGGEALTTFNEMEGMEPDCISFTGILYTCSHTGLVDEDDILT